VVGGAEGGEGGVALEEGHEEDCSRDERKPLARISTNWSEQFWSIPAPLRLQADLPPAPLPTREGGAFSRQGPLGPNVCLAVRGAGG
jgi:hypothetical protein